MWLEKQDHESLTPQNPQNEDKNGYKNQEWYKKLSVEQQKIIDEKLEQKEKLEKEIISKQSEIKYKWLKVDILSKWVEKNKPLIEDDEDIMEITSFEERIDMLNRNIDQLSKELYVLNLEANSQELTTSFEKSNDYFKKNLLKEWEQNQSIKDIINNKDLSNITAWEIYTLRQEWYDLSKLFLIWWKEFSKDSMEIWDKFKVNFGWNDSINRNIWAWDLLAINKIDKIMVNWVLWERKLSPRPGYYSADWKYLAIFDNYDIEIVSKKDYSPEEEEQSIAAFKQRFDEIRKPEILTNFRDQIKNAWDVNELTLTWFSKSDLEIVGAYLSKYLPKELSENIVIDVEKSTIKSKSWESITQTINKFVPVENLWKWYLQYKDIVVEVAWKYGIRPEKLITLINHENGAWDPLARAPWSSAYWLGQMIDSTWNTHWKWLDRNDPKDQLEATCRYLSAIMNRKNCPVELAMAYYNTGEWIRNVSSSEISKFARLNPAISRKIPAWTQLTPDTYFRAAVAYYNDTTYQEAELLA